MHVTLDNSIESYRKFLAIKQQPAYSFAGHVGYVPDEYANAIERCEVKLPDVPATIHEGAFDYQRDIATLAIRKKKYCAFMDCGLGKTLILLEFARHARKSLPPHKRVLIVSPLMVVPQTLQEAATWFPDTPIDRVRAAQLGEWTKGEGGIGITNYDALGDDIERGNIGGLILDESSMLKSHYGKWGQKCLELGRGVPWKLCCTGTPAPNDRIEFANHAVFMDHFPTVNSFLARFFVNRGQTQERWELKPHALRPFYLALSHWCIFLSNPATYGWKDNVGTIPPINVHIEHVDMTPEQRAVFQKHSGQLAVTQLGGIVGRSVASQLAKGRYRGDEVATNKFQAVVDIVNREPNRSIIVWCKYNDEQEQLASMMPYAGDIAGSTPHSKRMKIVDDFKSGRSKVLISKPDIIGFGLNLQIATRQCFSTLSDSYEEYYQAVKRSNRIRSVDPLDVYLPVTELEEPMVANVMRKAAMIERDTAEQELIFKAAFNREN